MTMNMNICDPRYSDNEIFLQLKFDKNAADLKLQRS